MRESGEKLLEPISGIVGEANASAEAAAAQRYAICGQKPAVVAWPATAEETAEILRLCAREKLAVVVAGAGTKLGMGAPPSRYDVALVSTRMDRIHGHDPGDLTLSVGAGTLLTDISRRLKAHQQFLPLSVPYGSQATVGGTVASGIDSPLRQSYGTVRDFLLGAEFVTGSGNHVRSGGRVVKNVAGYDLHKLLIGSLGTLGVITRMNFKTFPLPEVSRSLLATFGEVSAAVGFSQCLDRSPMAVTSLESLNATLAELLRRGTRGGSSLLRGRQPWGPTSGWQVAVGFGGTEAVFRRFREETERMGREFGATDTTWLEDETTAGVWERLPEAVPLLLDSSPAVTLLRIGVLPSHLSQAIGAAESSAKRHQLRVALLARAVGALYLAFLPDERNPETMGRLAQAVDELAEAILAIKGHWSIPWCPEELRSRTRVWGQERPDLALIRKVKQVFDPEGALGPGRFVGGL